MESKLLIDSVIRQTTVLVAQLATAAGIRAPLSHVADQVFYELATSLEDEGVTRKVAADMFGLALRSYQLKVKRLAESQTDRNISLWQAIFEFIREHEVVPRGDVLQRFSRDDQATVKGVLHDLVDSGLVFQTGGNETVYRAATDRELESILRVDSDESAPWMVWIYIYNFGPVTRQEICEGIEASEDLVQRAVKSLEEEGRIRRVDREGQSAYESDLCVIPEDTTAGWEASFWDHFNAVVRSACIKLREFQRPDHDPSLVGVSTYTFDVHRQHPHYDEVVSLLSETRARASALRKRVTEFNESDVPPDRSSRVTFYFGQSIIREVNGE